MPKFIIKWEFDGNGGADVVETDSLEEAEESAKEAISERSCYWVEEYTEDKAEDLGLTE